MRVQLHLAPDTLGRHHFSISLVPPNRTPPSLESQQVVDSEKFSYSFKNVLEEKRLDDIVQIIGSYFSRVTRVLVTRHHYPVPDVNYLNVRFPPRQAERASLPTEVSYDWVKYRKIICCL